MKNLLYLGVPILKHITVVFGYCQMFIHSCVCNDFRLRLRFLPRRLSDKAQSGNITVTGHINP